jgi:iron complex transport system permease protein
MPPMEVPAGIITAIIGSPYFLYILRRRDVLSA